MAKNSPIEWTHHTFNPWWGCAKVSPACEKCYAELWAKRMGHNLWGAKGARRLFSDAHWKAPILWNQEAEAAGERARVFCASMADVFESRAELKEPRTRLWTLIRETPWLDWLLLTKRPQNIEKMVPWTDAWPKNIWLGTTVENQKYAEQRLPHLLKHKATVRFLSCEPLLGPIDLTPWFRTSSLHPIDWVIAGGESGGGARPMHPKWVSNLLHQCVHADVPFHFKQWGQWTPAETAQKITEKPSELLKFKDDEPVEMTRLSKKLAGRLLEGKTWNGVPCL